MLWTILQRPPEEREEHVRALALSEPLSSLGRGWIRLSENVYALCSISPQHVDTTFCVSDAVVAYNIGQT